MDFDFLSSNLQIAYPFTENVTVGRFGANTELAPLLASAQIRTVDQRDELLSIEQIYIQSSVFPTTIEDAQITLTWLTSGDTVVLDVTAGTSQFAITTYGSWIVAEWYAPLELSGSADIAVKLIFHEDVLETGMGFDYIQIDKITDDLILHSSAVKQGPNKLHRVYWKHGNTLELVADRGEELIIRAGFNMSIGASASSVELDGERAPTRVAINAVPGEGTGRYLLCPGSQYLLAMNGVEANKQGDLVLKPLECYWNERELDGEITPQEASHGITGTALLKANEIKLNNSCGACCSCDDYIATYQRLHELWTRGQDVATRVDTLRDAYIALASDYNDLVGSCDDILLSLSQNVPGQLIVLITFCNNTDIVLNDESILPLEFSLTFTLPAGAASTYTAGTGVLGGSAGGGPLDPDSTTATTAIVLPTVKIPVNGKMYWTGIWNVVGGAGGTLEATVIASDGDLTAPRSAGGSIVLG